MWNLFVWKSPYPVWMDGHNFPPTCRLLCLLVFLTSRHILFREDGAHDNIYKFLQQRFVLSPILPLCSRPPGSVPQCPGDTSLVIIPFAGDHKTPAQDPTQPTQPRHMAAAAQHQPAVVISLGNCLQTLAAARWYTMDNE